jgi:hypothetical protein
VKRSNEFSLRFPEQLCGSARNVGICEKVIKVFVMSDGESQFFEELKLVKKAKILEIRTNSIKTL